MPFRRDMHMLILFSSSVIMGHNPCSITSSRLYPQPHDYLKQSLVPILKSKTIVLLINKITWYLGR